MEIVYLGHSSFRIRTKTATVVTDPYLTKAEADVVTVSHDHSDHNAVEKITGFKKVITGPGEYEVSGVSIIGIRSFHDNKNGEVRGKNTIYVYEAEGLRLAHLGDLGHLLDDATVDQMGTIDVLMIPVGGEYTIGPKEATEVVGKIDPYFIIPMHFSGILPIENFLREVGLPVENLPKFLVKKEDIIEDQNSKVIVLEGK